MKVCAVVVTYGDRQHLLEKVINRLLNIKMENIIVVANGCSITTEFLSAKKLSQLDFVLLSKNTGSAGGFKAGILNAMSYDYDYIWLLDDDNVPEIDALDILLSYHEAFTVKGFKNFALCSDRGRKKFTRLESYIGGINLPFLKSKETETIDEVVYNVPVCPYGGMFFHKSLIERIGLPNRDFFLYCDDYEWTYRITQKGGSIFLIEPSKVNDIDKSDKESPERIYYGTRNLTYFKKKLSRNKLLFFVGYFLLRLYHKLKGHNKVIQRALKEGYNEKLGKTF